MTELNPSPWRTPEVGLTITSSCPTIKWISLSWYMSVWMLLNAGGTGRLQKSWLRNSCGNEPKALAWSSQQMIKHLFWDLASSMALWNPHKERALSLLSTVTLTFLFRSPWRVVELRPPRKQIFAVKVAVLFFYGKDCFIGSHSLGSIPSGRKERWEGLKTHQYILVYILCKGFYFILSLTVDQVESWSLSVGSCLYIQWKLTFDKIGSCIYVQWK